MSLGLPAADRHFFGRQAPPAAGSPSPATASVEARNALPGSIAMPKMRFHDLRHTAATLLMSQGVPIKIVSEMLGHADVGITLRTYSHVLPGMQQQAADAMDKLFA